MCMCSFDAAPANQPALRTSESISMMDKCNAALERHERAAHARLSARGCQGHVDEKAALRVNTALVWCEEKSWGGEPAAPRSLGDGRPPGLSSSV